MLSNYICALDIGSSKIAAIVARIKKGRICDIFFENFPSKGIKAGSVVDSVELVNCISSLMKNLRTKSGIKIKNVHTNISGQDIVTRHSKAAIPLTERGNKIITLSDIRKAEEQARILGSILEEEIIHIVPFGYALDSKDNVINPLGLYSHRLEADLYLICAKLFAVQNISSALNQCGYEIKDLFFSGLASSCVVFNKQLREGTNLFCDIGSDITEVLLFKNGLLRDAEVLPIGAKDLTVKLEETLKIPFELAEEIKRAYGMVGGHERTPESQEILIKKDNTYRPVKQRLVSEIITSCAKQLCLNIKNSVEKKVSSYEVNNFIVAGRGVLLEGFIETLENTLAVPVRLARIVNPNIPSSVREHVELTGQKHLTYLTSLGMICEVMRRKQPVMPVSSYQQTKNPILRAINKVKEIYQEYF